MGLGVEVRAFLLLGLALGSPCARVRVGVGQGTAGALLGLGGEERTFFRLDVALVLFFFPWFSLCTWTRAKGRQVP